MNPSYGGPCQGIRNSIPALSRFGIDNEVVCFDEDDVDYGIEDSFLIHRIGRGVGPYSFNSRLESWSAKNLGRFDIVIVHGLWLHTSFGMYKAWSKFKRHRTKFPSLYIMPHGMLDPYFQKSKDRRFKAIRNSIFWHLFEKRVINGVDGVLFTCEMELELAKQAFFGYNPKKAVNIGYGIQRPPAFNAQMDGEFRAISGLKEDDRYFLFLSRIHEKKGIDLLVKAYMNLTDSGMFSSLPKLVIAGPLLGRYAELMQKIASHQNNIVFTGMLQGNAKWGALYSAESFILPSHQENFGIAVVESLACGTPVLITNKINIWKEIDEGKGGLIEQDDAEGVRNLLVRWIELQDKERSEYRKSARKTYEEYFTVESAASQFCKRLEIDAHTS
ncbi:glycosyltransferase [Algoriphagus oliviformis]|nr:glycosyltransferase [Algoriphagus oliviformis]